MPVEVVDVVLKFEQAINYHDPAAVVLRCSPVIPFSFIRWERVCKVSRRLRAAWEARPFRPSLRRAKQLWPTDRGLSVASDELPNRVCEIWLFVSIFSIGANRSTIVC